jgi:hypothetical protein
LVGGSGRPYRGTFNEDIQFRLDLPKISQSGFTLVAGDRQLL